MYRVYQAYVLISFLCTLTRLSMNELFDVTPLVACSGSRPYNARKIWTTLKLNLIRFLFILSDEDTKNAWSGSSKLTTSLNNVSLKFQTLLSEIRQYVWLKKNISVYRSFAKVIYIYIFCKSIHIPLTVKERAS